MLHKSLHRRNNINVRAVNLKVLEDLKKNVLNLKERIWKEERKDAKDFLRTEKSRVTFNKKTFQAEARPRGVIVRTSEQPRCPSVDEWIKKM